MSAQLYLATVFIIAGTFVLVFAMRYLASRQDARAKTSKEEAYHNLAMTAAAAQTEAAERLASLHGELAAVSVRLASIEKMLKDVG